MDTHLDGRHDFPSTCWSRILVAARPESPGFAAALDTLALAYWKPVYAYIRAKWGRSSEDAKDLTQDFFLWMLEKEFLARVDRERGRFRAVLKVALAHYLTDEHRHATREKRGGGRAPLSLDLTRAELPSIDLPDPRTRSPEQVLDDAWRAEVLARARARVEEELSRAGKEKVFAVFRDYYLSPDGKLDYAAVAARHGVSVTDVSNHLMLAKTRFREALRQLVAETVAGGSDLQEELNALFGGGAA